MIQVVAKLYTFVGVISLIGTNSIVELSTFITSLVLTASAVMNAMDVRTSILVLSTV
jgi:uncharacterized membrane protein YobD (UPF0266 family)